MENQKVLLGLSGGINSMAVLCWLTESNIKPLELHLYYAHFKEHSPDTFKFVKAGIRYARKHFKNVKVVITRNSIIEYFEDQNMIPHPMNSPCSKYLKIIPMAEYAFNNGIKIDLIGYVKHELKRRSSRQSENIKIDLFSPGKFYPIGDFTDEWCFDIVSKHLNFYPEIYDILWTDEDFKEGLCSKRDIGKRVFKHNNCLPCKNMENKNMKAVKKYYPLYHTQAMNLSIKLQRYWGRDKDTFYTTFGRELGQDTTCESCKF